MNRRKTIFLTLVVLIMVMQPFVVEGLAQPDNGTRVARKITLQCDSMPDQALGVLFRMVDPMVSNIVFVCAKSTV